MWSMRLQYMHDGWLEWADSVRAVSDECEVMKAREVRTADFESVYFHTHINTIKAESAVVRSGN